MVLSHLVNKIFKNKKYVMLKITKIFIVHYNSKPLDRPGIAAKLDGDEDLLLVQHEGDEDPEGGAPQCLW